MQDFRKLKVWEKAHALVLDIYRLTLALPQSERFGLTIQMRRSATAIPQGIAQGCNTFDATDFSRCVQAALRSAGELEYQLILCRDLTYADEGRITELDSALVEVKKMLVTFHQRLRSEP